MYIERIIIVVLQQVFIFKKKKNSTLVAMLDDGELWTMNDFIEKLPRDFDNDISYAHFLSKRNFWKIW